MEDKLQAAQELQKQASNAYVISKTKERNKLSEIYIAEDEKPPDQKKINILIEEYRKLQKESHELLKRGLERQQDVLRIEFEKNDKNSPRKQTCWYCGKEFFTHNYRKRHCSEPCEYWDKKEERKAKHQESLKEKGCSVCKKLFKPRRKNMVFCSNACQQKDYRKKFTYIVILRIHVIKYRKLSNTVLWHLF